MSGSRMKEHVPRRLSKEVGMSKLPSYGQIENDEGWCAIET